MKCHQVSTRKFAGTPEIAGYIGDTSDIDPRVGKQGRTKA